MFDSLRDKHVRGRNYDVKSHAGTVSEKLRKQILLGLKESAVIFVEQARLNVNLTDHDLKELARLGHPYAPGHTPIHPDDRLVHAQTGELRKSLKHSTVVEKGTKIAIYIVSNVPYLQFLLHGTSRMRARKFHEKTLEDLKGKLWEPLMNRLREFRHKVAEK